MRTRSAVALLLLVGCATARVEPEQAPATPRCEQIGDASPERLAGLFAQEGRPLVLLNGFAYRCPCGSRRLAGAQERRGLAGATEERAVAGATEQRSVAGATEQRGVQGQTERRSVAGATEAHCVAGQTEQRTVAGAEEHRSLAGAAEARRVSGAEEQRRVAGAEEERSLAGATESRRLAGAVESPACEETPSCSGFVVHASSAVSFFAGAGAQLAVGGCIP